MDHNYFEETVYTMTSDALSQEGLLIRPAGSPVKPAAVVWVHGFASNYYQFNAVQIGRMIAGAGFTFITGNNRGHDFGAIYYTDKGAPMLYGGGWEQLEESPLDISAWIDFAAQLGYSRVVLLGHSLGALKVMHYQAECRDPRVAGLISASPPLRGGNIDPEILKQAEQLSKAGRGRDLLPWGSFFLGAGTLSAQSYLGLVKNGRKVMESFIGRISCPLLAVYGTNEGWVGDEKDLETIRVSAVASPQVATVMIEGADHSYTNHINEVSRAFIDWIGKAVL